MKTRIMFCSMVLLLSVFTGSVFGGTEGPYNTFYGLGAGTNTAGDYYDTFIGVGAGNTNTTGATNTFLGYAAGYANTTGSQNTFLGLHAGVSNTTGSENTFLGYQTGYSNTTANYNTFLGYDTGHSNTTGNLNTFLGYDTGHSNTTGYINTFLGSGAGSSNTTGYANTMLGYLAGWSNTTGHGNVFLGYQSGGNEVGSNKLYIDNTHSSTPLIYGEFDTRNLTIYGNLEVIGPYEGLVYLSHNTDDSRAKVSRIVLNHYLNTQLPVYMIGAASTATNNFVAIGGGVNLGNAATRIDLFTAENTTTPFGTPRLTIIGNGYVGIGTQDPLYPLEMASGAYVTTGGVWTNASSREYKKDIEALPTEEALDTLKELNPVKFAYKRDLAEKHVGFIAEDVPELVSTKDRKGLSPMDIVAVLTRVVQEQQRVAEEHQRVIQEQQKTISVLSEKVDELVKERCD